MTSSINSRSSPSDIGRFINSQEDQTPVGKDHMPDITNAVNSFFKSHEEATVTHIDTSLLDRVTIQYKEGEKTQTAVLELIKPRSPSPERPLSSPSSTSTDSSPSVSKDPSPQLLPLKFTKELEEKIAETQSSLSKGEQNGLLINIVRCLSQRFTPKAFLDCRVLSVSVKDGWTTIEFASSRQRASFGFKNSL